MSANISNNQVHWPQNTYIISSNYHFIYCPIPKNACSSFKKLVVQLSDLDNKSDILSLPGPQFHTYVKDNFTLNKYSYSEVDKILLKDNEYFKFTVVRNPWGRLLASYLDKFVRNLNPEIYALNVIKKIYASQALKEDYEESITFNQFVKYVANELDEVANEHWKSQYLFLVNTDFDLICRFENLNKDFHVIREKLNLPINLDWINKTRYEEKDLDKDSEYSQMKPKELRKLGKYPIYQKFYTDELIELVHKRYENDIERFNYVFDT